MGWSSNLGTNTLGLGPYRLFGNWEEAILVGYKSENSEHSLCLIFD